MNEETQSKKGVSVSNQFRLGQYYYLIEVTAFAVLIVVGLLIYHFREFMPWIRYPYALMWGFFSIFLINVTAFLLIHIFRNKKFFEITRYGFILFFLFVIYTTGGAESSMLMLLLFPLLVSTVDLNPKLTKRVGIICTTGLALIIFADWKFIFDYSIAVQHVFHVMLYAIIASYMYKIVNETLQQKYEKEEAKRKSAELIELDKVKSDFVTVTSHQLRTPIAGIKWALDSLVKGGINNPEMERSLLTDSREKIDEALAIVNDMLATAENGTKGLVLAKDDVDIGELVRSVTEELTFLANQKRVVVNFHSVGSVHVKGDEKMLRASIINVVDNAIRYSPGKTVDITVLLRDTTVVIVVQDTGLGIPREDQEYVFDRFYRGKNVMKLEPNETGVGMYVTKEVIQRHGGTIAFESKQNEGTIFTVALPVTKK
ncbi:MAG: HAMP domain-containing sensor histidine kinase [Candidatus Paceibacterota bacterium]